MDKLIKYVKFILFDERYNIENLAFIIIDTLIRYYGVPKLITSDRDKLFISKYWSILTALLRIKRRLLIVYHPQTDGQTERVNQTLEIYLRNYINRR